MKQNKEKISALEILSTFNIRKSKKAKTNKGFPIFNLIVTTVVIIQN